MPLESVRDVGEPGRRVMVGWSNGKVQVGAINSLMQLTPTAVFDGHGTPQDITDTEPVDGVSVDLDREGINDLIRLLRKARDRAYGADA